MAREKKSQKTKGKRGQYEPGDFGRRPEYRDPIKRVLIACEGAETEVRYFRALLKDKRIRTARVEVYGPEGGTDPKSIVEFAKGKVEYARRDGDPFDEVWCVFDRDDHLKIADAMTQAKHQTDPEGGFEVAFSNPCFELWFLLHFRYSSGHQHRTAVARELKQKDRIAGYDKPMDVYGLLKDKQDDAIGNAKRLRKHHKDCNAGRQENPCTNVDELVVGLNKLAEEAAPPCQ